MTPLAPPWEAASSKPASGLGLASITCCQLVPRMHAECLQYISRTVPVELIHCKTATRSRACVWYEQVRQVCSKAAHAASVLHGRAEQQRQEGVVNIPAAKAVLSSAIDGFPVTVRAPLLYAAPEQKDRLSSFFFKA